jgi:hypothetical protein
MPQRTRRLPGRTKYAFPISATLLDLDIYEPASPRLPELLAAIAAKLELPQIDPGPGARHVTLGVDMDWERAYHLAQQALDEQGGDAPAVVRPVPPHSRTG